MEPRERKYLANHRTWPASRLVWSFVYAPNGQHTPFARPACRESPHAAAKFQTAQPAAYSRASIPASPGRPHPPHTPPAIARHTHTSSRRPSIPEIQSVPPAWKDRSQAASKPPKTAPSQSRTRCERRDRLDRCCSSHRGKSRSSARCRTAVTADPTHCARLLFGARSVPLS